MVMYWYWLKTFKQTCFSFLNKCNLSQLQEQCSAAGQYFWHESQPRGRVGFPKMTLKFGADLHDPQTIFHYDLNPWLTIAINTQTKCLVKSIVKYQMKHFNFSQYQLYVMINDMPISNKFTLACSYWVQSTAELQR